jgi:hypothetical protein
VEFYYLRFTTYNLRLVYHLLEMVKYWNTGMMSNASFGRAVGSTARTAIRRPSRLVAISRSSFHLYIILLLLLLSSLSVGAVPLAPLKRSAQTNEVAVVAATPEMIEQEYLRVAKKCGFSIAYTLPERVSGDVLTPEEAKEFLPYFFASLDIFHSRFLQETKLNTVVLCRDLCLNDVRAGGVASTTGIIAIDVPIYSSVIYHEMFHIADKQRNNPEWTKLNRKQFVYGGNVFNPDEEEMDRSDKQKMDDAKRNRSIRKDFVSDYAMTSEMEDRAETFAVMVTDPRQFEKMASESQVLKRKAEKVQG